MDQLKVQRHATNGIAAGKALRRRRGRPRDFERTEQIEFVQDEARYEERLFDSFVTLPPKTLRAFTVVQQTQCGIRTLFNSVDE
jgi:hypothetical protein